MAGIRETPAYRAAVESECIELSQCRMHLQQTLHSLSAKTARIYGPDAVHVWPADEAAPIEKGLTVARQELLNLRRAAKKIRLRHEREERGVIIV